MRIRKRHKVFIGCLLDTLIFLGPEFFCYLMAAVFDKKNDLDAFWLTKAWYFNDLRADLQEWFRDWRDGKVALL